MIRPYLWFLKFIKTAHFKINLIQVKINVIDNCWEVATKRNCDDATWNKVHTAPDSIVPPVLLLVMREACYVSLLDASDEHLPSALLLRYSRTIECIASLHRKLFLQGPQISRKLSRLLQTLTNRFQIDAVVAWVGSLEIDSKTTRCKIDSRKCFAEAV